MQNAEQSRVILIFIDGLGIGRREANNPLSETGGVEPLAVFGDEIAHSAFGGRVVSTDPRLGVEGRPQSASGQTTILTGVNAPKLLGYHKQGFPNEALRQVILEKSIFRRLRELKIGPNVFANAYSPQFFTGTLRWKSATTHAVEAAGDQFLRFSDLRGRRALFHDFTNRALAGNGHEISEITAREAAEILTEISTRHRFTLYEHFITDKIGHKQDREAAAGHLPLLAEFVRHAVELADLSGTTVFLTSDHGNIEDLSVRTHTLNDVPTIIWGRNSAEAAERIRDLSHITPTIISLLKK